MRRETAIIAILVVLAIVAVALVPVLVEDATQVLPPTGLDIVRVSEYPGYGKLTLILHQDGTCVLAGDRWALYAPGAWCE